jgi:hypothetical protein
MTIQASQHSNVTPTPTLLQYGTNDLDPPRVARASMSLNPRFRA